MTPCPQCESDVTTVDDRLYLNEILPCPDCGSELEVVGLQPLLVALAPEIEEDWGE